MIPASFFLHTASFPLARTRALPYIFPRLAAGGIL